MMEQVYHIYIKKECLHDCPLCCNKFYDMDKLPIVTVDDLRQAHTVCLTGGEPFLIPANRLYSFVRLLRYQYLNIKKVYIYGSTLSINSANQRRKLFDYIDGINIAPKNYTDWLSINNLLSQHWFRKLTDNSDEEVADKWYSNRLYVFDDQKESFNLLQWDFPKTWHVIGRKWDTTFNTPANEHFVRLPILL